MCCTSVDLGYHLSVTDRIQLVDKTKGNTKWQTNLFKLTDDSVRFIRPVYFSVTAT